VREGELSGAPLGTTAIVRIPNGHSSEQDGVHVPLGSLFDAGKGTGVWVIHGEPAKVSWRAVTVQRLDDARAEVTGQIKSGERIVALGAHLLREGEQVRVAGVAVATATKGVRP